MKLIDADALFKPMSNYDRVKYTYEYGNVVTVEDIKSAPIIDAVEVVRCKDCKYASPNGENGCKAYHFKLYETHEMEADDFCSRAERRTDERSD